VAEHPGSPAKKDHGKALTAALIVGAAVLGFVVLSATGILSSIGNLFSGLGSGSSSPSSGVTVPGTTITSTPPPSSLANALQAVLGPNPTNLPTHNALLSQQPGSALYSAPGGSLIGYVPWGTTVSILQQLQGPARAKGGSTNWLQVALPSGQTGYTSLTDVKSFLGSSGQVAAGPQLPQSSAFSAVA
jgi:hypothetical protein